MTIRYTDYGGNLRILFSEDPANDELKSVLTNAGFNHNGVGPNGWTDAIEFPYFLYITSRQKNRLSPEDFKEARDIVNRLLLDRNAAPSFESKLIHEVEALLDRKLPPLVDRLAVVSEIPAKQQSLNHQMTELKDILGMVFEMVSNSSEISDANKDVIKKQIEKQYTEAHQSEVDDLKLKNDRIEAELKNCKDMSIQLTADISSLKAGSGRIESDLSDIGIVREDDYDQTLEALTGMSFWPDALGYFKVLGPTEKHKLERKLGQLSRNPKDCIKNPINRPRHKTFYDTECTLGDSNNIRIYWLTEGPSTKILGIGKKVDQDKDIERICNELKSPHH